MLFLQIHVPWNPITLPGTPRTPDGVLLRHVDGSLLGHVIDVSGQTQKIVHGCKYQAMILSVPVCFGEQCSGRDKLF